MASGIPGILIGAGSTFVTQELMAAETPEPESDSQIPVAHTPNDEMSFREAFEAAREEVGPGGAFTWHGNVYSTYRSDDPEWIALGPDGQAAHCQEIANQVHADPFDAPVDNPADPNDVPQEPIEPQDPEPIETDVHITEIREDPGSDAIAAIGEVDGVATVFIDEDGDGNVDIVLHDDNGDGQIEESEVYSAEGTGITIEALAQEMDHGQDVLLENDQPDYTNDITPDYDNTADVNGF